MMETNGNILRSFLHEDDSRYYATEISSLLPVRSMDELDSLENKLEDEEFMRIFETYLRSVSINLSFEENFRNLATDNVLHYFNLDGRSGKRALKSLILFRKIFRNIHASTLNNIEFENKIRKQVKLAHNRHKKAKSLQKSKSLKEDYISMPASKNDVFVTEHINISENIVNENRSTESDRNLQHRILEQLYIIKHKQDEMMKEIHSLKQDVNTIKQQQQQKQKLIGNVQKKNLKISSKPIEKLSHAEVIEINSLLPVNTVEELDSLEERLEDPEFMKKIQWFVSSMTENSSFTDIFRNLATDKVLFNFNLDGRHGKRSLKSLNLFGKVFQNLQHLSMSKNDFERKIRKEISRAHNRLAKTKNRLK